MWEGQWAEAAVSSHSIWAWPSICSAVCHGAGVAVWGGDALECCGVPRGTYRPILEQAQHGIVMNGDLEQVGSVGVIHPFK